MSHGVQPAQSVSTTKDMKERTREGRNVKALSETASFCFLCSFRVYLQVGNAFLREQLVSVFPKCLKLQAEEEKERKERVCVCVFGAEGRAGGFGEVGGTRSKEAGAIYARQ